MAEQNCRKSAEARLDAELRKLYKLQAQSQELAFANTKLQQQLKASKNAVWSPLLLAGTHCCHGGTALRIWRCSHPCTAHHPLLLCRLRSSPWRTLACAQPSR